MKQREKGDLVYGPVDGRMKVLLVKFEDLWRIGVVNTGKTFMAEPRIMADAIWLSDYFTEDEIKKIKALYLEEGDGPDLAHMLIMAGVAEKDD